MDQIVDEARAPGGRRASYSSPLILERRRRILEQTRKLIAEQGLAGFSMDELCKRAGVAKRTLYNAFQNREHLIAVAIQDYFEGFANRIQVGVPEGTLGHLIERIALVVNRSKQIVNYNRALMAVYHSPDVNPEIWATIHAIGTETFRPYIEALAKKRQLQPWIDSEQLIEDLTRYRFAAGNDWCNGRIPMDEYLGRLLTGMLSMLAGATRGAARKEIEAILEADVATLGGG